ncbi:MAG: hypothetical protein V2A70_00405 [Candidatus Omnitrophota bacterium]
MTSFISSFNKFWIISAMVLLVAVELVVYFFYPLTRSCGVRDQIDKNKPDIVFIGSSPLISAVKESLLSEELKQSSNKDFKVFKATLGGTGMCYWQLILKNQIVSAQHQASAVGIVLIGSDPTSQRFIYDMDGSRKESIRNQVPDNVSLHYRAKSRELKRSRLGDFLERVDVYPKKRWIASDLFHGFVNGILNTLFPSAQAGKILNGQFHMDHFRENFDDYEETPMMYDFDGDLQKSFLPDIMAIKKDYNLNLFFVVLPTRRDASDVQKVYFRKFKEYLDSNGVKLVSLWDDQALRDPMYFQNSMHVNVTGAIKITQRLAKELLDQGIVK